MTRRTSVQGIDSRDFRHQDSRTDAGLYSRTASLLHLALVLLTFLILYGLTSPVEGVDTLRYAADSVKHASGIPSQYWDFGHLLWRPWGYLGYSLFGQAFQSQFHDTPVQATARFLIITNFIAALAALTVFWDWLRRLTSISVATLVTMAFCGANAFLQQICMGSAYMPAIFFQFLSLWLLARATLTEPSGTPRSTSLLSALAGLSFALSAMLWISFLFTGLGIVLSSLFWMDQSQDWSINDRRLARLITPFLIALAFATGIMFSLGANLNGVHDLQALSKWITAADNGWSQSMNLVRSATGFPRSFFELTAGGVSLKRWFLHDPYHPVRLAQLIAGPLLKLAVFYLGMLSLLILIARTRSPQRVYLVMAAGILPLVFFAVVFFEATSTSRFLPTLAFLFAGIAIAFQQAPRRSIPSLFLVLLLVSAVISNFVELGLASQAETAEVRTQKSQIEASLTHPATVFTLTLHEPFYLIPISRPLDHSMVSTRYDVKDLVEQASTRILHWRGEFAQETLASWHRGREVWVTASVFAAVPPPTSTWVEGDDKRIDWNQIHAFFEKVTTDKASGGPNGFVRVADSATNQELFSRLAIQDRPDLPVSVPRAAQRP